MILHHGSYLSIPLPDLLHSRKCVDFGKGFYTTPLFDQASKWAQKFRISKGHCVVSRYEYDEEAGNLLRIRRFTSYSEEWFDFVIDCRNGNDTSNYDIVIGGVADDNVFNTIELFCDGFIDKKEALSRLRYNKPNMQICFRSDAALACLTFVRSDEV